MASPERMLLKGPMPNVSKLSKKELREECQMWRNVWGWVPHEVKYYVARTGQTIGLTQRNYKRYMGILLDTHWTLDEIELGVYDKQFDYVTGDHYFERKIIKIKTGALIDTQWIKEREPESAVLAEAEKAAEVPTLPPEGPGDEYHVKKEEKQTDAPEERQATS